MSLLACLAHLVSGARWHAPWAVSSSGRRSCTAAIVRGHYTIFGVGIGVVWQVGWAYGAKMSVVETHQTAILNKVGLPEMSKHAIKCRSASSVFFILDIFEMSTLLCW